MADETKRPEDEASDGLEDVGPDMLRLLLREERKAHEAEVARLREEAADRERALRRRRGEVLPSMGTITQGDLSAAPLDQRMELHRRIAAGDLKLIPGPKTPTKPAYSITREEIARLPLDERVKVQQDVLKGRALLVKE